MNKLLQILIQSVRKFRADGLRVHAAALAYFAVFSLPPLLIIIIYSTSQVYDQAAVESWIYRELGSLLGERGPAQVAATIKSLLTFRPKWWTGLAGVLFIFYMATTAFANMKNTLNHIFDVESKRGKSRILQQFLDRVIALGLVLALAMVLLFSMVISSLVKALQHAYFEGYAWSKLINTGSSTLLSFIALVILFSLIYMMLPNIRLKLSDTIWSAVITSMLFLLGRLVIALLIKHSRVSSFYDAAGSLMLLMIWVYYTSVIFYFGACITSVMFKHNQSISDKKSSDNKRNYR